MPTTSTVKDSHAESNVCPTRRNDDQIIQRAIALLEERVFNAGPLLEGPSDVRDYLRLKLIAEPNEVFAAVFLNSRHQVLAYEPLFHGTIDESAVYPRVVVQRAIAVGAAAVIFAHQHPSGCAEPSTADRVVTQRLRNALVTIDVRVLDYFIVGKGTPYSFAQAGLL